MCIFSCFATKLNCCLYSANFSWLPWPEYYTGGLWTTWCICFKLITGLILDRKGISENRPVAEVQGDNVCSFLLFYLTATILICVFFEKIWWSDVFRRSMLILTTMQNKRCSVSYTMTSVTTDSRFKPRAGFCSRR